MTMLFSVSAFAAEIDKTSLVGTSKAAWNAPGGPVTIDGVSLPEKYETTTATLGDVMWQTVEGLDNGTYIVELYANARYTPGRGFNSDATDGALDFTYLYANNVEISIPVYHNGDLNNGQSYTLEGVEVTDGTLKMGMTKKAAGSNWHTIQIKALKLIVSDDAALADAKAGLLAVIEEAKAIDPATAELTAAIEVAQGIYDSSTDVEAIKAAVAPLQEAINAANLANASKDNPVLTDFVVNGTFDSTTAPWVSTTNAQNRGLASNQQGAFTGNFFENWNGSAFTGKIYQTIENIPNGVYELSICAFVNNFDASCQYVYGNDAKTYLTAGEPTAYKVIFEVTNNTAEIGFEQTVAKANWCGIDNVSLTYFGAETSLEEVLFGAYIEQVAALRPVATEYLTKGVNAGAKAALEDALAATETIEGTVEAYEAAITALNNAINAAKTCLDKRVAIDNMYDLLASTNVYTQEAYDTYKAAADAYFAKWENDELTEVVVNPYAVQGWHAEVNYDDFLLSAWGTNNFDTNLYINTWSTEGGADGSNFTVPFFEYWTGDDQSLGETTKTATITGLTPGAVCKVSAWVRARLKNNAAAPTYGITLSVGADGTPVDVAAGTQVGASPFYLGEYTAVGVADAEGNLTINFNVAADNNISWLSFKNVKYTVISGTNLDFSEGTPVDNHICTYAKDVTANGTTYSQMQPVTSWDIAGENGDARAAGVFAYGSNLWLGSAGNYVPATNPEGVAEGNALGAVAVWSATAQYTQNVTLLPGTYNLMVPVYKASAGANAPQKGLIGFIADNGTEYLAPAKVYTQGAWTYEIVTFTLDEETNGVLSLGYTATNAGSASQQALFFDCVKFVADSYIPVATLKTAISAAEANANAKFANVGEALFQIPTSAYETYVAAIADAKAVANNAEATAEELAAAVEALAAATTAFAAAPVNTPDPEKTYMIMHQEAGTFLSLNGGVKVEAEQTPIKFEAAADGKYYIANANGEYVYYSGTGNNIWSLNVSTDNKEAWTIAAVGNGAYTIKGKNGHLGTDAATAGSSCFGDKAATNWVITEYVEPVAEFEVTMVNPAGATAEKIAEGESVEFTTNWDDKVGFMLMTVEQIDPATSEVVDVVTSFGTPAKGETNWKAEAYFDVKFREGFNYKFTFYAYENEDAYNQEPWEAPYSAAIATDEVEIAGALAGYVYSTATLNDITPAFDAVIESETDNVVTLTFSAPVKVQDAQTVVREGGFMAPPTVYTYTPVAVDADENGFATTWTFEMKLFPGSTNVTFAAVDAEGRRVWGNMGEEETSYFSYEWTCTVGIPDITIAPAGEVEGPVAALTASCEAGIGDFTWMCEMSEAAVLDAEGNVVATVAEVKKEVDPNLDQYSEEWYEALKTTPNTLVLSTEITEPGTYTVKIPAGYFTVDSEKMFKSKAVEATFTIIKNVVDGINGISAGDVVKTQYFGLNGAAIDAPVKGINIVKQTLKNGKVVTSKVYVK